MDKYLCHLSAQTLAAMFKDVAAEMTKHGMVESLIELRDAIMVHVISCDTGFKSAFIKALGSEC